MHANTIETLLAKHIHAYAPATPAEELLVFRITQKTWLLHRLETWERVIADSRIAKVRKKHPSAAAPACLALSLLEANETEETRFHHRTADERKHHESALDSLEAKLSASQQRREARSLHAARRDWPTIRVQSTMRDRGASAHAPTRPAAT